jgi:DUF2911 family protein/tetratricopeptide repeat protein
MRKFLGFAALILASWIGTTTAHAQSALLNLPRVSQHARITQRIGLTDITIDYSRPQVRGRKIFGGTQTYGKVWRAGANENTTIEFTDPLSVEGHALPAGKYAIHFIPNESSWVVIFSKNSTSWGSFTYNQSEDALRLDVTPRSIPNQEVLTFDFDDPTPTTTTVILRWEKISIPLKITVNTPAIVEASLRNQLRGRVQFEWQAWQEAAVYLLDNNLDPQEAEKWAEESIGNEDRFENEITKSRALTALGRKDDARAARDKAISMGTQPQIQVYARTLQAQGHYDDALDLFRANIKKDPNSWIAHNEQARIDVAAGNFDKAIAEMKLAGASAPDGLKGQIDDIIKQLERHVDINK